MRNSVSILFCLATLTLGSLIAADSAENHADDIVTVKVVGVLKTNLVKIGGETTGTVVRSKGIDWELEFGKDADLKKSAENLDGKRVTVEGSLERRAGVEVKERWIVTVTKLQPVKD